MNFTKIKIILLIILFILINCSSQKSSVKKSLKIKGAEIKLFAHPRQGFTPITIFFEAQLMNYEGNAEAYRCLIEKWDFGDGSKSEYQPNCDEAAEIKTKYMTSHLYTMAGNFRVQFTLSDKGNVLLSNPVCVNIISSGIDRSRNYE